MDARPVLGDLAASRRELVAVLAADCYRTMEDIQMTLDQFSASKIPIVRYMNNPNGGPDKKVAVVFENDLVKVFISDGITDEMQIVVRAGSGIEIIGAITQVTRLFR